MKIIFTSHKLYPEFKVYEDNKLVIQVKIDNPSQAFRITCLDNKRVFFIADEVVKKTKITTLLNEYSQQLGSLIKSNSDVNAGEIEIEGKQYTYKISDDFSKEIYLFKPNKHQPVISSKLEMGQSSFPNEVCINYLLFALAWFTFLVKEQSGVVQFAEA